MYKSKELSEQAYEELFNRYSNRLFIYSDSKEHLTFIVLSLEKLVGKEHIFFIKPHYKLQRKKWFIEVAFNIPKVILHRAFSSRQDIYHPSSNSKEVGQL